ncbi:MAG: AMP-binding protein [Planctomycetes bacterium]|nr:AMP-binding protein [Planctomycetota bacterium]
MKHNPEHFAGSPASIPWQQEWVDHYSCDLPTCVPYPRTPLTVLLERAALRFPDHPACTLYGRSISYAELDDRARRLATSLVRLGAGPGRHVGLLLPNMPEYLIALQATWLTGATVLQLSPLMVAEELHHWLEATGCHLAITLDLLAPNLLPSLAHGPLEHLVVTSLAERLAMWKGWLYRLARYRRGGGLRLRGDEKQHLFDSLLSAEPIGAPARAGRGAEVDPAQDVAVLAPTGGTTASPKAVMLTHRNLLANAMQLRYWYAGEDGSEGMLGVLPFFHSYGLSVAVLACWAKAGTVHLYPRFETKAVLQVIEKQRPELVPAVPAMLSGLNALLRKRPHDLSFIRTVISGAAALDPNVRREFESFGAREVIEGYGLTEASPVTHANLRGERNKPGTIGVPLADTEAKVVDPGTGREELPAGATGELVVRGPQVMKGYFNNPLATEAVLRDGWLSTGDMVRRDSDGYFTLVDRKKDIIKTSGFLVFPAEVEEVLMTFAGVAEAAVVGQPDAEKGEVVKALLVPREGARIDLAALEEHCKLHLGRHKRPRQVEVVSELPKNFLGKVLRRRLREVAVVSSPSGNGQAPG